MAKKTDTKTALLTALVALLPVLIAELGGTAPAAAGPEAGGEGGGEGGGTEAEGPTLEQLREKAQKLMADGKAPQIKKILAGVKAESLTKLDAKHYQTVSDKLDELEMA